MWLSAFGFSLDYDLAITATVSPSDSPPETSLSELNDYDNLPLTQVENMQNSRQTSVMEQLEDSDSGAKWLEIAPSKWPFNASFLKLYQLTTENSVIDQWWEDSASNKSSCKYHRHTNLYKIWSLRWLHHAAICAQFLSYACTYLLLPHRLLLQTFLFRCNHSSMEKIITKCTSHCVTQKNLYWPPEAQNDWGKANGTPLFVSL